MSEEPKSIWKKSWKGHGSFLGWLVLATGLAFVVSLLAVIILDQERWRADWGIVILGTVGGAIVALLYFFIRWIFCRLHFKRFLFACVCLITLIALAYAEEDWRGWHAWNQFKHEWEAKGEKFNFTDFVPPPVPDDQNFAFAPIWIESIKATLGAKNAHQWKYPDNGRTNFTDRLWLVVDRIDLNNEPTNGSWVKGTFTDLEPWQAYYRAPIATNRNPPITTNEFPIAPQPQTPAQDVLLALSKYDLTIEELRQASQLPYSRFPLNYDSENPGAILLPHLAVLKRCAQVLQLRAIAELQNGQRENALDDVKLMLRLTDSAHTEPDLITHLVRIAMLQFTLQPVWEGLAEHQWSEAQLAELEPEFAKLDFVADYQFTMCGELAFLPKELEYRRRTRDPEFFYYNTYDYRNNQKNPLEVKLAVFMYRHCPGGWFYQNQIRYCRFAVQNFLPALDASRQLALPALVSRGSAALQEQVAHSNPYNFLERKIVLDFNGELYPDNFVEQFAYAQSSVDLARVAIALERYRLARGEFPETLDALAPQFMAKIPHDIIGGQPSPGSDSASQPLHYRRTSGGQFVLYSVGWNETDDGGVVVLQKGSTRVVDINQGDWVWRYPAR